MPIPPPPPGPLSPTLCPECGNDPAHPMTWEHFEIHSHYMWNAEEKHQEKCPTCNLFTLWVDGAPEGMWAVGFMSR